MNLKLSIIQVLVLLEESLKSLEYASLNYEDKQEIYMHIVKEEVNVKVEMPGAILRQKMNFGSVRGYDNLSCEYFTLSSGVDTTPLCEGLEGNECQSPHWGYVLRGRVTMTDHEGLKETVTANELFYWPAGHNVKVDEDAEIIMFSPQEEHAKVIDHFIEKMKN